MLGVYTGRGAVLSFSKRSSLVKDGFSPLSAPACNNDLEDILSEWTLLLFLCVPYKANSDSSFSLMTRPVM